MRDPFLGNFTSKELVKSRNAGNSHLFLDQFVIYCGRGLVVLSDFCWIFIILTQQILPIR